MKHLTIKLEKIVDVKEFYRKACAYNDLYLHQGNIQIPANTFMGVFTLDLEQPVKLVLPNDETIAQKIADDFGKWVV